MIALIATDAKPGEPHSSEGTSEAEVALDAPGEAGRAAGRHGRADRQRRPRRRAPPAARGGRRYSPVVMRMAAEHDLDLERIEGTGRGGRVRKQDVLAYLESGGGAAEPPMHIESPYKPDEPAAPREARAALGAPAERAGAAGGAPRSRACAQSIGRAMVESLRTAATCTTIVEADMSRVEAARKALGVSYLPIVARATVDTLREFPALNATLEGETLTTLRRRAPRDRGLARRRAA